MSQTKLVNLTKKVAVVLEKRGMRPNVKAQVGFAVDISGSMRGLYSNGTMQEVVNRIQAIANRFDDNQTLDMWAFHTKGFELDAAIPAMFGSYVNEHILNHSDLWGGTSFAPVTKLIENHYFGSGKTNFLGALLGNKKEQSTDPVYLIFLTDGDNDDEGTTTRMISELAKKSIYIQFVGVGRGSSFKYIRQVAEDFSHVGFVDFSDPSNTSDEQMYEKLLSDEFVRWMNTNAKA